jgi:cephalosporin hydroxylase
MKLSIDTETRRLIDHTDGSGRELPLDSAEAFELISRVWLHVGWGLKYSYSFTWLGRPVIQLPEDLLRVQELVYRLRPDVIVETGVAYGGSLVFYATLCRALGHGRVIGVDVEVRPHNRAAIEAHPLSDLITLIEGSSTAPATLGRVREVIGAAPTVLVVLDSCHRKDHVLAELEAYAGLVRPGAYLIVTDGIMRDLVTAPGAGPDWRWNNPCEAVAEFLRRHPEFTVEEPGFLFNEGAVRQRATYWPAGHVKRVA